MSRYQARTTAAGAVLQGGLDPRPRAPDGPTVRGPARAVVVAVRVSDSQGKSVRPWPVEADVILARSGQLVRNVPVAQPRWGIVDASPWVPHPATRVATATGGELNVTSALTARGSVQTELTPLDAIDGDTVLVDWIEGDWRFPVVIAAMPHPATARTVVEGDGYDEADQAATTRGVAQSRELFHRFGGVELRVSRQGDVLIDLEGATADEVEEDPAQGNGSIRLRIKEDRRVTVQVGGVDALELWHDGSGIRIDLGEAAGERLVLGDSLLQFLQDFLTNEYATHVHPTGTGPSGAPTVAPTLPTDALLSDIARTKKS